MSEQVTITGSRRDIVVLQASNDQVLWQTVVEDTPSRRPDLWYRRVTYTIVTLSTGQSFLENSSAEEPWRPEDLTQGR